MTRLARLEPNPQDERNDQTIRLTDSTILQTLAQGEMEERGLLPYSSNHSFLIVVHKDGRRLPAVYKPQRGESPLWDFEWGTLCKREAAAYVVSQTLGWQLVPPTVLRQGTRGLGSVQFFIANDADAHYFTVRSDARFALTLRRLVLFDFIINNADRKSGHCLISDDGRLWAIDHGICFHSEYKLRSVVWEFSGQPIDEPLQADVARLRSALAEQPGDLRVSLQSLLDREEVAALQRRVERLLRQGSFPAPLAHRRNYPWPPI